MTPDNQPRWPRALQKNGPFQEVWYLKFNDPHTPRAVWLRLTALLQQSKKIAQTWAIVFDGDHKSACQDTYDISKFLIQNETSFSIGPCHLSDHHTQGKISLTSKQQISWDLQFRPKIPMAINLVPKTLQKLKLIKNEVLTPYEDLRFTGWVDVDGKRIEFKDAPGMQGHLAGKKNGHSWAWAHCNSFQDPQGKPADFIFEGLTARARIGKNRATPPLSTFYFRYQGLDYACNSLIQSFTTPSRYDHNGWTFEVHDKNLLFKGFIRSEKNRSAGITYEDTDGSYLYCANSKLSDIRIEIYRNQKIETTLEGHHTAAYEVVTRTPPEGVPLLI